MAVSLPLGLVAMLGLAIFVAGALNGVAGFGFALVGTTVLATVLDPATAVVFMILPIVAVNLTLIREVSVVASGRAGPGSACYSLRP
ncbi:MAG: hypothetical protein U5K37_05700 [Natrialbaceae archaeon]|nr:hypothetical protein [Natrialbaceae archaeon]